MDIKITQHEKILIIMLRDFKANGETWFRASDFQREHYGLFIGYEATARMSELVKQVPFIFETRQNGRFREVKLKIDGIKEKIERLPASLARHFYLENFL